MELIIRLDLETVTSKIIAQNEAGEKIAIFEVVDHADACSSEEIFKKQSKPRYQTAKGDQVIRLSENSFRILSDEYINQVFQLYF